MGIGQAAAVMAALGNIAFADAIGLFAPGLGRQMPVNAAALAAVCVVAAFSGVGDARGAAVLITLALLSVVSGFVISGIASGPVV